MKNIKPAKPSKQEALAIAWAGNLAAVLLRRESTFEEIESKFKTYAEQNPTTLSMALRHKVNMGSSRDRIEGTITEIARATCDVALKSEIEKYKKAIALFSQYGVQDNTSNHGTNSNNQDNNVQLVFSTHSGSSSSSSSAHRLSFDDALKEICSSPADKAHGWFVYQQLKESIKMHDFQRADAKQLKSLIESFYMTICQHINAIHPTGSLCDDDDVMHGRLDLFEELMNLFVQTVVLENLKRASRKEMIEVHAKQLFIIKIVNSFSFKHNSTLFFPGFDFLNFMLNEYQQKQMPRDMQDKISFLILFQKFRFYLKHSLYEDLMHVFNEVFALEHVVTGGEVSFNKVYLNMLLSEIIACLDYIQKDDITLQLRLEIVGQIEKFIKRGLCDGHEDKPGILKSCQSERDAIDKRYFEMCELMLPAESAVLKCQLNVARKRIEILPLIETQGTHFRKVVCGIDHVQCAFSVEQKKDIYFFAYYGCETDTIFDVITQVAAIQADQIVKKEVQTKNDAQSSDQTTTSQKGYFLPVYDGKATSASGGVGKGNTSIDKGSSSAATADKKAPKPDLDKLTREIWEGLGVLPRGGAQLYPINHPGFPNNRKHLCWACWLPDSLQEGPELPPGMLKRFQDLLENEGNFANAAFGDNGLKGIRYFDEDIKREQETYEMKLAKENYRVFAYPTRVTLSTKEKAWVLCFGTVMNHKQMEREHILRLSPQDFLKRHLGVNNNNFKAMFS